MENINFDITWDEIPVSLAAPDGIRLSGIHACNKKKNNSCIVLCHGITADKNESGVHIELTRAMLDIGIDTFRFDFRAHGESGGEFIDMCMSKTVTDIKTAVSYMENEGYNEIFLLGGSFGGGIAALYTAGNPGRISKLVLFYPLLDYESVIINPVNEWGKTNFGKKAFDNVEKQGYSLLGSNRLGKQFFYEAKTLKPWENLLKIDVPVIILHGDNDLLVPFECSERYSEMSANIQLYRVEGGSHGFISVKGDLKKVIGRTVEFLKS